MPLLVPLLPRPVLSAALALCAGSLLAAQSSVRDTVLVDLGVAAEGDALPRVWSALASPRAGASLTPVTSEGCTASFRVVVADDFAGRNASGTDRAGVPGWPLPADASYDSFFGHVDSFNGRVNAAAELLLLSPTWADPAAPADSVCVEVFASRLGADNRDTRYTLSSAGDTAVARLDPGDNRAERARMCVRAPVSDDTVRLALTAGPDNTTPQRFFYAGALRVDHATAPRVAVTDLRWRYPGGGEVLRGGGEAELAFEEVNVCLARLEFSPDDGLTWQLVDTVATGRGGYTWQVPIVETARARLRVRRGTGLQQPTFESPRFAITLDTTPCRIVVLGSSTAAGTGPSTRDSAWVWRYRRAVTAPDTRREVVNLARGGYTTYRLLPTGTPIPAGIPMEVDTARNITAALTLDPEVIVINLPSNDAANGFTVAQQLDNYALIVGAAEAAGVPVYVATPQPRDFGATSVAIQLELLDSTYAVFGERAVDFWSGFAEADGTLRDAWDSGDGVHLNDSAHAVLAERVLAKALDTLLSCRVTSARPGPVGSRSASRAVLRVSPNPAAGRLSVAREDGQPFAAGGAYELLDGAGRTLRRRRIDRAQTALEVERGRLPAGHYRVVTRDVDGRTSGSVEVVWE